MRIAETLNMSRKKVTNATEAACKLFSLDKEAFLSLNGIPRDTLHSGTSFLGSEILPIYCPSHEHDGTPRCCSCEQMEPRETRYAALNDGRKLCLECLDSSVMDTSECQPLYYDIQAFSESLSMRVEQKIPLLLVERQALNEAMDGERNVRSSFLSSLCEYYIFHYLSGLICCVFDLKRVN
ncbi:putative protein DA1 [Helianthus annuus]|nr:putative protein DA1 [Helianthus annuus]KAJ0772371.1 putative protein DA1 [Helianthus annuus]